MISAFVFDIGNVLLRFDFDMALRRIEDRCGNRVTAQAIDPLKAQYEDGRMTTAVFQQKLTSFLRYTGTVDDLTAAWTEIFTGNAPMISLVHDLHGRVPLFLLSNTSDLHVDYVVRTYPVFELFDDAVYSYRAGVSKPDPAIFQIATRQFGIIPSETVYIDDLRANVEAARQAGFQAIEYHPDHHDTLLGRLAALGWR